MTHFTRSAPTASAPYSVSQTFGTAIVTKIKTFGVKAVWRRIQNKRHARNLLLLDDHMLSDLGLTRGDVRACLHPASSMPPMVRLKLIAVQRRAAARALAEERLARNKRKPGRTFTYEDA